MPLHELATVDAAHAWLLARGARGLTTDSRRVTAGDAFIAWPGYAHDARHHVPGALAAGASACLIEARGAAVFGYDDEPRVAAYDGLKAATGRIASRFAGEPSERLSIVACTGTNGKTSTAWWVAQALAACGRRCGLVGTLGVGEPPRAAAAAAGAALPLESTGLTTPDPVTLQATLRRFVDAGFAACAIEASSIGIVEHRLAGTRVEVAVFTNFTQDHLDYHGDMTAYWQAKAQLFAWPGLRAAVINVDDERGAALAASLDPANALSRLEAEPSGEPARAVDVWTHGVRHDARLRATDVHYDSAGLSFDVHEAGARASVTTGLIGDFNVSNLLAVIGVLRASGVPLEAAAATCAVLSPVPGRMQRVGGGDAGPVVLVDYAHTPDALEKALGALQRLASERGGQLWCVFGCGGNRDPGKRPLMGAIARRLAERVVVTSDNPRFEVPDFIISNILAGLTGHDEVDVIENRADAIAHALANAADADVVLLAGKGHEDYQEIGGNKLPFSDAVHAAAALERRRGAGARA
ncbi:UDP-N-acetylmuramoyl-L-alanyl-D-glutamate--2,6-diaminopimelate ligase [Piscinibacter koreensis]|uniref:UDP-N-acetylmuramoyl-L-alanyl-D-glutamate--2,6-diaminopimelate ligase n=1 Tax=Piscinibacter koreensis TaxID=2742824 RepID=A0A7Y6TZB4_9BURK|nr:UDP-N-acetylmuramoyl-L-alanyl-D-glutamate--2,6-diaminopimelate ligase [Schlegelella koreensis]NUZ08931.1 UDP-N-acetylmuramoyl-L-alanyl-D-glutamate--2,6-diaminopimelate ligase [Schlegelella koreensis]